MWQQLMLNKSLKLIGHIISTILLLTLTNCSIHMHPHIQVLFPVSLRTSFLVDIMVTIALLDVPYGR